MAFPHHGYARATLDIDIFIEPTPVNAARTRRALFTYGSDVTDVSEEDLLRRKILIRQYIIQVDIHPFVTGAEFESVWSNSEGTEIGGEAVRVPSLDDLIAMKEAAARPKDVEDLKYLRALRKGQGGSDPQP